MAARPYGLSGALTALLSAVKDENVNVWAGPVEPDDGDYTDDEGGICPMLAAHRHGGRTTLLAFARSWDAFAGSRRVRRASRRELAVLERELTASLQTPGDVDLRAAIAEHEAVFAAIRAHDPQAARAAMQQHMDKSHSRFSASWRRANIS